MMVLNARETLAYIGNDDCHTWMDILGPEDDALPAESCSKAEVQLMKNPPVAHVRIVFAMNSFSRTSLKQELKKG